MNKARVSVGSKTALTICTCGRPRELERLLKAVDRLSFEGSLSVVVVDNHPDGAGRAICKSMKGRFRWPLIYEVEQQRGISFARNRGIAAALRLKPDNIAMLDDDEWPCQGWLSELLDTLESSGADVVGGPVHPVFADRADPPSFIARYYGAQPGYADGSRCVLDAAGNFLARAACFRALMPAPFDPKFALTGGEDKVFFQHLAAQGYIMRWCSQALAFEEVPAERNNPTWLRRRYEHYGNLNVRVQRMFAPGVAAEFARVLRTLGLLTVGGLLRLAGHPHRPTRMRATLMLHKGYGKLRGHLGRISNAYAEL